MLCYLLVSLCFRFVLASMDFAIFDLYDVDDVPDSGMDINTCSSKDVVVFMNCTVSGKNTCLAIRIPTGAPCQMLPSKSWSEKGGPVAELWVRRDVQSSSCSPASFPYRRGRSRYRVETTTRTWAAAASHCESLWSKLAQISTNAEYYFVQSIFAKSGSSSTQLIIGHYQLPGSPEPADGWVWHRSKDAFGSWGARNPSNSGGKEHFGTMYLDSGVNYNDIPGSLTFASVCECFIF